MIGEFSVTTAAADGKYYFFPRFLTFVALETTQNNVRLYIDTRNITKYTSAKKNA
jgi:hypothetical protein